MTDYFYFDQTNRKCGPIDEQQLRELAAQGIIKPNTPMETAEGHKGIAKQIPDLQFASTISRSAAPEWYGIVAMICGVLCIVYSLWWLAYGLPWLWFRLGEMCRDCVFVIGMFFGCRGMSANRAIIAKIGLILCIIAFTLPRVYGIYQTLGAPGLFP